MTELIPDEDGFTELVDPHVPRVDLVDLPANGAAGFLLMKQDSRAGLMSPQTIRDLIGKTVEPSPQEDTVTMTGTPGAIAKLIHEASVRREVAKATGEQPYEQFLKEKYNTEDRKRMAGNGEAMDDGSYPIADHADLTRAIRAVGRGGAEHDAIRRHIIRRAKALGASSEIPENWAANGSLKEVTKMAVTSELDGDVVMAELDATVVLAEPDGDIEAPGDMNEPGSPAWEAIDAATARKWTSIAVRLRNALCVMAEREMLEAATGELEDAEAAWDLKDAECALDYVIDTLAGFAVEEQAEAELAAELEMVGKALHAVDVAALDTFEALAPVAKAGRVLSAANEQAIREAADSLQKVLASLPAAPVEKTANEEDNMPTPTTSAETVAEHGGEPAMGTAQVEPKPVAGTAVTELEKADGEKPNMVAVFNAKGKLVGIVDPSKITPVDGAEADDDNDGEDDMDGADDGETADLTPQPAAEAGTPADTVANDEEAVTKTTHQTDTNSDTQSSFLELVKSALAEHAATQTAQIATAGDAVLELAGMVETLKGQVKALEEQTAEPKVFTNGAVPPRDQMRGQDRGTSPQIDLAKAREQKDRLYKAADATEQNRIAQDMQSNAIDLLAAIHQWRP